jgi:cytoskeletal protein CcmA (bactofilin family)
MFGNNKDSSASSKMETIIGPQTVVQGTLSSRGTIRIDGKVEGGISESSTVIIGEKGEVHGDISAGSVVIGGSIIGNIHASASVEILSKARIQGDIKTALISIAEGAVFEGNCTMPKEKQVIEMNVPSSLSARGRS